MAHPVTLRSRWSPPVAGWQYWLSPVEAVLRAGDDALRYEHDGIIVELLRRRLSTHWWLTVVVGLGPDQVQEMAGGDTPERCAQRLTARLAQYGRLFQRSVK